MTHPARVLAAAASLAILASACGGATAPTATAAPTVAPTVAATTAPTVAPTVKPIVAATGQGSTSTKLTENKVTLEKGSPPYLPAGAYLSTVSLVTLETGGRTLAHKHGGVESIFVLEGTVDFRTAGGVRAILKAGQGAAVPPNTALQAVNGGDGVAKFLAFFMTQETAPFQTAVDEAP